MFATWILDFLTLSPILVLFLIWMFFPVSGLPEDLQVMLSLILMIEEMPRMPSENSIVRCQTYFPLMFLVAFPFTFNFSFSLANVYELTTYVDTSRTLTSWCTVWSIKCFIFFFVFVLFLFFYLPPIPLHKPKRKKLFCSFIFNQQLSVALMLVSLL